MTSDQVLALTSLTETQRKVMDLACRGRSDRQIAQQLSLSLSHVMTCMNQIKRKLKIDGDGHRVLVHYYWSQGPGYAEIRAAAVSDALREVATKANQIISLYRKLEEEGRIQP